jgi:hypothetical protein
MEQPDERAAHDYLCASLGDGLATAEFFHALAKDIWKAELQLSQITSESLCGRIWRKTLRTETAKIRRVWIGPLLAYAIHLANIQDYGP